MDSCVIYAKGEPALTEIVLISDGLKLLFGIYLNTQYLKLKSKF